MLKQIEIYKIPIITLQAETNFKFTCHDSIVFVDSLTDVFGMLMAFTTWERFKQDLHIILEFQSYRASKIKSKFSTILKFSVLQ